MEDLAIEPEFDRHEVQVFASISDGNPAVSAGMRLEKGIAKMREVDLVLHEAQNAAGCEHAARGTELHVSEMFDPEPGQRTEEYDNRAPHVIRK